MNDKKSMHCLRGLFLAALLPVTACAADNSSAGNSSSAEKIVHEALGWKEKGFRVGVAEQCMNWTREVLVAACGKHFNTLETQHPWDEALLGPDDELLPEHADSLANEQFGEKISRPEDLQPGDLVFFKNTYGNWAAGVYTHVGIAMGDGKFIHRQTSNHGLVRVQPIPVEDFAAGIRLKEALCDGQ